MEIQRCYSRSAALFIALLILSAPAYATSQCPAEFGPKDPLTNVLGWLVVAVGVAMGGLLFTYLIRRSRGMRWLAKSAVIVVGFATMVLVWVGSLGLAVTYFFLRC